MNALLPLYGVSLLIGGILFVPWLIKTMSDNKELTMSSYKFRHWVALIVGYIITFAIISQAFNPSNFY